MDIQDRDWEDLMYKTELGALEHYEKFWDTFTPKVCNEGSCDIFAEEFVKMFGDKDIEVWYTDYPDSIETRGHTWVKYKGRFYDAEVREGVVDYKDLPYIKRSEEYTNETPIVSKYL